MEIWMLRVTIMIVLVVIGIQDLRLRGVSWYLFPLLVLLLRMETPVAEAREVLINIGFILLLFLMLTAWFYLKLGRLINIFDQHIGVGDLLFLLCVATYFTPGAFFLFYLFSLSVITVGTGIYLFFQGYILKEKEGFTIPLAGLQGLLLLMIMLVEWATGFGHRDIDLLTYFYEGLV